MTDSHLNLIIFIGAQSVAKGVRKSGVHTQRMLEILSIMICGEKETKLTFWANDPFIIGRSSGSWITGSWKTSYLIIVPLFVNVKHGWNQDFFTRRYDCRECHMLLLAVFRGHQWFAMTFTSRSVFMDWRHLQTSSCEQLSTKFSDGKLLPDRSSPLFFNGGFIRWGILFTSQRGILKHCNLTWLVQKLFFKVQVR